MDGENKVEETKTEEVVETVNEEVTPVESAEEKVPVVESSDDVAA